MTVTGLSKRITQLQSKIPPPRFSLAHISTSDLERLEEHFLTAYANSRASGVRRLPGDIRSRLEDYLGRPRSLSRREIQRICKPPPDSTFHSARMMGSFNATALGILPKQSRKGSRSSRGEP